VLNQPWSQPLIFHQAKLVAVTTFYKEHFFVLQFLLLYNFMHVFHLLTKPFKT